MDLVNWWVIQFSILKNFIRILENISAILKR